MLIFSLLFCGSFSKPIVLIQKVKLWESTRELHIFPFRWLLSRIKPPFFIMEQLKRTDLGILGSQAQQKIERIVAYTARSVERGHARGDL